VVGENRNIFSGRAVLFFNQTVVEGLSTKPCSNIFTGNRALPEIFNSTLLRNFQADPACKKVTRCAQIDLL